LLICYLLFFFQAEDGIRDRNVTGVQTCALPIFYLIQNKGIILTKEQIFDGIWGFNSETAITVVEVYMSNLRKHLKAHQLDKSIKIGRASCREREEIERGAREVERRKEAEGLVIA